MHGLREASEEGGVAGVRSGDGGTPVLHRDVKSANIGLARHEAGAHAPLLYAKLLDCGLSKAVHLDPSAASCGAGGGGGGGAASFTGGLAAGTPGYMAHEVADGVYTVRSEVYSFGVVLLELLTGARVGPRTAKGLQEAAEDRGGGDRGTALVAAAAEAGVWPPPAVAALAALVLACIHPRESARPAGMPAVISQLHAVRALVVEAADAAAAVAAMEKEPLVPCPACLEDVPAAAVTRCLCPPAGAVPQHALCHTCLASHVRSQLTPRLLQDAGGAIPCAVAGCPARPWALEDLAEHLDKATLLAYGIAWRRACYDAPRARREAETALAAREAAARVLRVASAAAQAERVAALRAVIVERHLLLRCPRCAAAFDDYSGCNALTCGTCGASFCAVCLADCGADADTHSHCMTVHGGYYDRPLFERTHRAQRAAAVACAVAALAPEGALLQRALVAELARADLRDLGIDAAGVLRAAGVAGAVGATGSAAVGSEGGGSEEEEAAAVGGGWICPACTLHNGGSGGAACDACGLRRPSHVVAARALRFSAAAGAVSGRGGADDDDDGGERNALMRGVDPPAELDAREDAAADAAAAVAADAAFLRFLPALQALQRPEALVDASAAAGALEELCGAFVAGAGEVRRLSSANVHALTVAAVTAMRQHHRSASVAAWALQALVYNESSTRADLAGDVVSAMQAHGSASESVSSSGCHLLGASVEVFGCTERGVEAAVAALRHHCHAAPVVRWALYALNAHAGESSRVRAEMVRSGAMDAAAAGMRRHWPGANAAHRGVQHLHYTWEDLAARVAALAEGAALWAWQQQYPAALVAVLAALVLVPHALRLPALAVGAAGVLLVRPLRLFAWQAARLVLLVLRSLARVVHFVLRAMLFIAGMLATRWAVQLCGLIVLVFVAVTVASVVRAGLSG